MDTFTGIIGRHLRSLTSVLGDVPVAGAAAVLANLPDDEIVAVIERSTVAIREFEALRTVAAGIAAERSAREAGHAGLAQSRGHRSAVTLVQQITGVSRHQAGKVTRLGRSLVEASTSAPTRGPAAPPDAKPGLAEDPTVETAPQAPWHACLGEAFTAGRISVDQQTAIRRGLGEPPESGDTPAQARACAAWAVAAEQLVDEASRRTVEDLGAAARSIRDQLDPEGAQRRFHERFERRSFRIWTDHDGLRRGSFVFEDAGAASFTAILDAALRPRRGGPRFVDPSEKAAADRLVADPRSNEQLAYDLLLDVLHAGAVADARAVFGTRQAGVRVVITQTARRAAREGRPAIAVIEDTNQTVPAAFAAQQACDTGALECSSDGEGNPLNLGREARLFSSPQRIALAIRDGGCCAPGCDRPASYCETHHIDEYSEGGRTNVDRGILLCRFHHMNLHHRGWRIRRDGTGPFILYSAEPDVPPIVLHRRLERRYAFGDLQPPPARFRPAA